MTIPILIAAISLYAYQLYHQRPRVSRQVEWLKKSIKTADSYRLV